jgi:hypothetical protein
MRGHKTLQDLLAASLRNSRVVAVTTNGHTLSRVMPQVITRGEEGVGGGELAASLRNARVMTVTTNGHTLRRVTPQVITRRERVERGGVDVWHQ